jgi:hypothetical protein
LGLVVGIALGALVSTLWHVGGVTFVEQFEAVRGFAALASFLIALLGLLAIHELVHALVHPGNGTTERTVIGASLSPLLLYAAYLGKVSRNRYVAVLLAPFLLLSVSPALLCAAGLTETMPSPMLATLTVVNAAASGVDLFGAALILSQVPRRSCLQNHGWPTYWQPSDA